MPYKIGDETNMQDIEKYIDEKCNGNIYARCLPSGCEFDEYTFLKSKSFDEFVVECPENIDDAEELVEKYDLPGNATMLASPGYFGGVYGIEYEGVNALQTYDETLMGHGIIVIFEGEYLGENLLKDGDVVKPTKVIEVIHN